MCALFWRGRAHSLLTDIATCIVRNAITTFFIFTHLRAKDTKTTVFLQRNSWALELKMKLKWFKKAYFLTTLSSDIDSTLKVAAQNNFYRWRFLTRTKELALCSYTFRIAIPITKKDLISIVITNAVAIFICHALLFAKNLILRAKRLEICFHCWKLMLSFCSSSKC